MEEQVKYFTPSIEDIRVGYECELYMPQDIDWEKYDWEIFILEQKHFNFEEPYYPLTAKIRTPYLTKEQIEAEGWVYVHKSKIGVGDLFEKNEFRLWTFSPYIHIDVHNHGRTYYGECKDINTFRYICKLLKIS